MMRAALRVGTVLFVAIWSGLGLHAQSTFTKSYAADTINYAHSIAPADDGGFVIAGKYQDTTFNKSISLAKVDSLGVLHWSKKYGPVSTFCLPKVVPLSGGNFLVVAQTPVDSTGGRKLFLLNVDAAGDVLWTGTYELPAFVTASNAVEMPNGDLILACYSTKVFYLTRVTSQGSILWSHGYQGGFKASFTSGNQADVILTNDSGIVACGTIPTNGPTDGNGFLMKTDLDGDLIWAKFIGGPAWDGFNRVVETVDGGYLVMGHYSISQSYPIAVRTDANGTVLWRKRLSNSMYDRCWSLVRCPDGNYLFGGDTYDAPTYRGLLFKLSDAGDAIWSNMYGDGMIFYDATLAHGGMAVAAMHYGTIPFHSMTLLRGDTVGASNCQMMPHPLVVDDILLTESNAVTVVGGLTQIGSSITTEPLPLTEMSPCLSNSIGAGADGAFSIHPNPASDQCSITCPLNKTLRRLEIVDVQGRAIVQRTRDLLAPIDVSALHPGIYLFRMFTADGSVACERVVLE